MGDAAEKAMKAEKENNLEMSGQRNQRFKLEGGNEPWDTVENCKRKQCWFFS